LKERVLLIGQSLVEERDKNTKDLQEIKKVTAQIKEENIRIKEMLQRITNI